MQNTTHHGPANRRTYPSGKRSTYIRHACPPSGTTISVALRPARGACALISVGRSAPTNAVEGVSALVVWLDTGPALENAYQSS
jgi:hypothetical protein